MSKRPASVVEILAGLGLGTAAAVGALVTTACVGNPAPAPREDAGTDAGVTDAPVTPEADSGNP